MFNKLVSLLTHSKEVQTIDYTVLPHDNIFDIAIKFDCNIWKIKHINNLPDLHINVGQQLKIVPTQLSDQNIHYSYINRINLLNINIAVPILYRAGQHCVYGILKITYDHLTFVVNSKKLQKQLKKKLSEDEIETYNFTIHLKEVHKIKFNPISEIVLLYLWGVNHCMAPQTSQDGIQGVEVHIQPKKKKTKVIKQLVKQLCELGQESKCMKSMEAVAFLLNLLHYEHEHVVQDSLNSLIKPLNYNIKPIQCSSMAYHYQQVFFNLDDGSMLKLESNIHTQQLEQQYQPRLLQESRILDDFHLKQIRKTIPIYLQEQNWNLIFTPSKHGNSYMEFMRRTENVGPHIIVVQDKSGIIFGSFVSSSWQLSKSHFFGTGETYLFTFQENDRIQCFTSTLSNNCYLMADETGISIGAGEKYGLFIRNDFYTGSSFPCDTFNSRCLTSNEDFTIVDIEFWGFDESVSGSGFEQIKKSLFH